MTIRQKDFHLQSYFRPTCLAMVAEGMCFIVIGKDEKIILWQNFQSESCNFEIPFRGKLLLPSHNFLISWFILSAGKT